MPKEKPIPKKRNHVAWAWDQLSESEVALLKNKHDDIPADYDLYAVLKNELMNYSYRKRDIETQLSLNDQKIYLDKMITRSEKMAEMFMKMNEVSLFQLFDEGAFTKIIEPSLGMPRIRKTPDRKKKDYLLNEMNAINRAAKQARHKLKGQKSTKDVMRDHFYHRIASMWEEATGKKASIWHYPSTAGKKAGKPGGPFLRFLKDMMDLFGISYGTDEAIDKSYERAFKK